MLQTILSRTLFVVERQRDAKEPGAVVFQLPLTIIRDDGKPCDEADVALGDSIASRLAKSLQGEAVKKGLAGWVIEWSIPGLSAEGLWLSGHADDPYSVLDDPSRMLNMPRKIILIEEAKA